MRNAADGVEAVVKTGISEDELASIIGEYDGLIIRSDTKVTAKVLANPGKLKGVARAGVGVDNIDVKEATRKGILVMNTPGGNTLSAAEHTMALMLAMSRNVVPACNSLKSGAWDRKKYTGNQLNRKVLGLIGLGRIGMAVAQMARGFNMKVLGFDPLAAPKDAQQKGVEVTDDIERILKESDFISLHVPKNEQTLNMIGARQIEMMKPTVRLVNCARGSLVDHDALIATLNSGHLSGAGLDVTEPEPLPAGHPLLRRHDVIVTPHVASSTVAGRRRLYEHSIANALAVLSGRPADVVAAPGQPTTHKDVQP